MHLCLVFISCLLFVLQKDAEAASRHKRFFWSLFGKPNYQMGANNCPTNAICMPGSKTCVNDTSCAGLRCCKSFVGSSMCCMNLPSAGVVTTTVGSTTTLSTTKPTVDGGGGGVAATSVAPAAGAVTTAPPAAAGGATAAAGTATVAAGSTTGHA